jgi:nitrogen fixation protein NifX
MLKVAVASNDGITVDEHFGRAAAFRIYDVHEDGTIAFIENRAIVPQGQAPAGTGHRSEAAVEQLRDVNAVLAAQIGPGSQSALQQRGIHSFALGGSIEKALASYGKRHKLLDTVIPGRPKGYSVERKCGCSSSGKGCKG